MYHREVVAPHSLTRSCGNDLKGCGNCPFPMGTGRDAPRNAKAQDTGAFSYKDGGGGEIRTHARSPCSSGGRVFRGPCKSKMRKSVPRVFPELKTTREKIGSNDPIPIFREGHRKKVIWGIWFFRSAGGHVALGVEHLPGWVILGNFLGGVG